MIVEAMPSGQPRVTNDFLDEFGSLNIYFHLTCMSAGTVNGLGTPV